MKITFKMLEKMSFTELVKLEQEFKPEVDKAYYHDKKNFNKVFKKYEMICQEISFKQYEEQKAAV